MDRRQARALIRVFVVVLTLVLSMPATAEDDLLAEAAALSQQAVTLHRQARYAEAEPLIKRALEIRESTLGPDHPDVATSLNNLALLEEDQGRYAEAEPLFKRALEIKEKALGPDHPGVAGYLNNLASLDYVQGRYADAEPIFKRALAIMEKALGPDHPNVATNLGNLALIEDAQGRYAEAEPLFKRVLAIREKALGPDHPDVATTLIELALLDETQGRYAEAEPLFKRALEIKEKALGPDHPDVATSLNDLASLDYAQGRYAEAERLFERAVAVMEKAFGPDHPNVATSLNNLAELYRAERRYAEAKPLFKRALAMLEKALGPDNADVARSLNNLALLDDAQGRHAQAEPLFKRALAIRERALGADHPDVAASLNNLALFDHDQGRYAEAEPLFMRALAIKEKALGPDHPDAATILNNLAVLYRANGHLDRALQASARAVEIMMKHLSIDLVQRSGATVFERRSDRFYFTNYVEIADAVAEKAPEVRHTTAADTFRVAQIAQASNAGAAIAGLAARLAAGGGTRSAMIRERQDLVQQWQRLDGALVKAVSRPSADRRPAAEAILRASIEDATRRLDALDARIATEFPAYAELSNPKPLSAEAAQALLGSDEALLVYMAVNNGTWLWIVRPDTVALHGSNLGATALAGEVTALRASLDPALNPGRKPFPASRAYALYQKLIGPAEPLLAGVRHLLIVPDGALQSLAMTVLVTKPSQQDPQRPVDHRDIAWLARDYAVTVLPAVSSLRALRQFANAEHASAPFLGIGNPVLTGTPARASGVTLVSLYRGATADVDKVRALPPLPETADELRAIARTLGASDDDLLLGARASEPVLRQMPLDRYKIIEFATHGLMSGELKGLAEPALVLTPPREATPDDDGLLTASKIATLKLNADWVVLSACNTAASDGTPDGGGLSGLAKAFFYAGARSLLVSHWPALSDATVKLTTGTFTELAKDPSIGRAEALRRSMMAMLDPANPPEFAHPSAWAPFVLAGEGGAGR